MRWGVRRGRRRRKATLPVYVTYAPQRDRYRKEESSSASEQLSVALVTSCDAVPADATGKMDLDVNTGRLYQNLSLAGVSIKKVIST